MTTDNPKVSGYVSQEICDHLKTFKEERKLKSISEALGVVLAEYFEVDQKAVYQTSLLSGDNFVSIDRFEALEKKFSELNSSLPSELERMFSNLRSELLSSLPKEIEPETVNVKSESLGESQSVSLSELLSESIDEPLSELVSEPEKESNHLQLDIIDSGTGQVQTERNVSDPKNQLISVPSEPSNKLSTILLAKRLKVKPEKISKNKKEMAESKFYAWIKNEDPEKILWQPVGGNLKIRVFGWIPADDTPSELLGILKEWLTVNPE